MQRACLRETYDNITRPFKRVRLSAVPPAIRSRLVDSQNKLEIFRGELCLLCDVQQKERIGIQYTIVG